MKLTPIAQAAQPTMSHVQLSDLTGVRRDNVKRTIETLESKGVVTVTQIEEPQTLPTGGLGKSITTYHVNERDSYVVVAQLSPEFTAKLVDFWMANKNQAPALPATYKEALIALVAEVEAKEAAEHRALLAEKTKAHINDKRTATLMAKASHDSKRIKKLEDQLQTVGDYRSMLAAKLPQRVDTEFKSNVQSWRLLKEISDKQGHDVKKVKDARYGEVNTYHVDVIAEFKELYI